MLFQKGPKRLKKVENFIFFLHSWYYFIGLFNGILHVLLIFVYPAQPLGLKDLKVHKYLHCPRNWPFSSSQRITLDTQSFHVDSQKNKQTNNVQYPLFEEVTLPTYNYLQIGPYSQNFEFIVYLKVLQGKTTFCEKRF